MENFGGTDAGVLSVLYGATKIGCARKHRHIMIEDLDEDLFTPDITAHRCRSPCENDAQPTRIHSKKKAWRVCVEMEIEQNAGRKATSIDWLRCDAPTYLALQYPQKILTAGSSHTWQIYPTLPLLPYVLYQRAQVRHRSCLVTPEHRQTSKGEVVPTYMTTRRC